MALCVYFALDYVALLCIDLMSPPGSSTVESNPIIGDIINLGLPGDLLHVISEELI